MVKQSISQACPNRGLYSKFSISDNYKKINLYNPENSLYHIQNFTISTTCEDICIEIARSLGIGTLAFYLFSLFVPSKEIWIPPCIKMIDYINKFDTIYFRFRYLPAQLASVIDDPAAFDYLFFQIRHDFINAYIPNINALKINDCLGLAVTDILRMREDSIKVNVDFRGYMPTNTANPIHNRLRLWISGNKAVKEALYNYENHINTHDKLFYQEKYIDTLLNVPEYFIEKYNVNLCSPNDKIGQKGLIYIEIKDDKNIMFTPLDSKMKFSFLCNIRDLCFITLRSSLSIELSRKNGIPIYLDFEDSDLLYSFLSLLDGYYRLSEKFNFNLCTKCFSPLILKLKKLNIHGPVNDDFVISKLNDKAKNKSGTFIIRQSLKFDTYILDTYIDSKTSPKSLYIVNEHSNNSQKNLLQEQIDLLKNPNEEQINSSKLKDDFYNCQPNIWHLENSKETFNSLKHLLDHYSKNSEIKFQQCIPPSDYEHSNLLICQKNIKNVLENKQVKASDVQCILLQDLTFPLPLETLISNGTFNNSLLPNVFWDKDKVTKSLVSVKLISGLRIHKRLDQAINHEGQASFGREKGKDLDSASTFPSPSGHIDIILKMINSYAFLNDPTIVKTFGVCLDPILIITEPLSCGSLDEFLRSQGGSIRITELLEACSIISKALWYLEECKLPHGNLRCSSIYVHSYSPNKLSVKLSDPIITIDQGLCGPMNIVENDAQIVLQKQSFQSQRLPWLAPEHFNVTNYRKYSPTLTSDVWAYGTTAWEIFSFGKNVPWNNMRVGALKREILNGLRLPRPSNCPRELYYLINECWMKNRRERKRIQELVRDVHQIYHHALNLQDRMNLKQGLEQDIHNYELVEKFDDATNSLISTTHHRKFPDLRRALPSTPNNDVWTLPSDISYEATKGLLSTDIPGTGSHYDKSSIPQFLRSSDKHAKLRAPNYTTSSSSRHSFNGSPLKTHCAPYFASHSETDLSKKMSYYSSKIGYGDKDNYSNTSIDRLISKLLLKATNHLARSSSTKSENASLKNLIPNSTPDLPRLSLRYYNGPIEDDITALSNDSHSITIVAPTQLDGEHLMTSWANNKFNLLKQKLKKIRRKRYKKGEKAADTFHLSALPGIPHDTTSETSGVNKENDLSPKTYRFSNGPHPQSNVNKEYVYSKCGNIANKGDVLIDELEITYLSKLGEGNFGEVWLALWDSPDSVHEERVAIKKLKRYENALEMADFENEINILKDLSHPNVVQVKGICQSVFKQLVIEYLSNGSLEQFLKSHPNYLSTHKKLKFAIDICEGMVYLAHKGIVHRDLAARNILITNDMSSVKISDFGLSKIIERSSRREGGSESYEDAYKKYLSTTGCDYGGYYEARTPRKLPICWYAPETIDPTCTNKRFNQRTDVWSFGVTLWELFPSTSTCNATPQDPVFTTLKAIMNQCIAKNPETPNDFDTFLSILTAESFITHLHELLTLQNWRLPLLSNCPRKLYQLLVEKCWVKEQKLRDTFVRLKKELVNLHQTYVFK